jgi:hypothetical protein
LAAEWPGWRADRRYPTPLQQLGDDRETAPPASCRRPLMPMKLIGTRSARSPEALNEKRSIPLMRIPRPLRLLLALPFTFVLTGCISSYTLVKVNPTGAGTVEQTTLISPMMVGMMSGMAQSMGGEEGKKTKPPTINDLFKEEELRKAADNMGQGVRFVSSKPAKADGREGVTAVYAFDDVTKLSVNNAMKAPGGGGSSAKVSNESPIVFTMTPGAGGAKVLSIAMPEGKKDATAKKAKPEGTPDMKDMPPEALAMMKGMFQGAKFGVDVEVPQLIKSNSPYVTGSRVTLMEIDLGALVEDPTKLQKMQDLGPGASFEEARKVLGDVKGVKLPASRVTTIEFK